MSQEEIYRFLESNKSKWFTNKEIEQFVGCQSSSVSRGTKKLCDCGWISKKDNPTKGLPIVLETQLPNGNIDRNRFLYRWKKNE